MKDKIIKTIQKFLNGQFTYKELLNMTESQKDFLLHSSIIDKTDESEYNAIWDTIMCIENHFFFAKNQLLVMTTTISVSRLYETNHDQRLNNRTAKD